jgi:chaperonin cofactor prefoldin
MPVGVALGDRAQWRAVYELLKTKQVGDLVEYDELSDVLGRDVRKGRGPYFRATEEFLAVNHRALENVRRVGYRVVEASDHEMLARRKHKGVRRGMRKVTNYIRYTNRDELTPEVARRFDAIELNCARMQGSIDRLEARQERTEQAVQASQQQSTATDERVAKLEAALRDKGFKV